MSRRSSKSKVWSGRGPVVAANGTLPRSGLPESFPGRRRQYDLFPLSLVQGSNPAPEWNTSLIPRRVWIGPPSPVRGKRAATRSRFTPAPAGVLVRTPGPTRDPRHFCLRRQSRKQVLFAYGVAGRRGLGRNGVHRNASSYYSCGG